MIHYKDRSYCSRSFGEATCGNSTCHRFVAEEDSAAAQRLGIPFSITDFKTDDCGYQRVPLGLLPEEL